MVTAMKRTREECPEKVKTQQPGDIGHPAPGVYLEKLSFQRDSRGHCSTIYNTGDIAMYSTQNVHRHESRKKWSVNTMESDSTTKKNERMPFAGTSLYPGIILWSEVSQNQKEHYQCHRKYLNMHITNWFRRKQTVWATEKQTSDCQRRMKEAWGKLGHWGEQNQTVTHTGDTQPTLRHVWPVLSTLCNDLHENRIQRWAAVSPRKTPKDSGVLQDTQSCAKAPPTVDKKSLNETEQTRPRHLVFLAAHSTLIYSL